MRNQHYTIMFCIIPMKPVLICIQIFNNTTEFFCFVCDGQGKGFEMRLHNNFFFMYTYIVCN